MVLKMDVARKALSASSRSSISLISGSFLMAFRCFMVLESLSPRLLRWCVGGRIGSSCELRSAGKNCGVTPSQAHVKAESLQMLSQKMDSLWGRAAP